MENSMKASGKITKCMAKALSSGLMEEFTLETTSKTKNMVSVLWSGPMEKFMRDTGNKESKMGRERSEDLMELKDRAFGKMVIE